MSVENVNIHNFSELRQKGIEALAKALGPVGAIYFLRQFEQGQGNYTTERDALLADVTMADFRSYVEQNRKKTP